ncbi:MAG: hypothetical protein J0L94_04410 [Rhodothermia bacterium]|nr:hypothetical protein [Rhodothermia bacterium]
MKHQIIKASFPETVQIGTFERIDLPVLLSPNKGILFKGEDFPFLQMQEMVLKSLIQFPNQIKIRVFDDGLANHFKFLKELKDTDVVQFFHTEEQIKAGVAALKNHIREVNDNILGARYHSLQEFNASDTQPEPYYWVLMANYPKGFTESQDKDIAEIVAHGSKAGVFTLLHKNPEYIATNTESLLSDLSKRHCYKMDNLSISHSHLRKAYNILALNQPK